MNIIDTHAHLCSDSFADDLPEVLARAGSAGISRIIAVSENIADAACNLKLAELYPQVLPAAGLYPENIDARLAEDMYACIRNNTTRLIAIGEVGLDYWKVTEEAEQEMQRHIFSGFIGLSLETGLALNVHSRSAGRHAVRMLLDKGAKKVQMHAYDGKASSAMPAVEAGFFFSIPPSIIRSRQKQKLVKNLPLESILVETDSPVLGPDAGVRNEPANIHVAMKAIAEIKRIAIEEVAQAVYNNTCRLYGFN
jgi:TatD DNase family protein